MSRAKALVEALRRRSTSLRDTALFMMLGLVVFAVYSRYVPYSLVWNRTPSIPVGVYLAKERQAWEQPRHGDIVCFPYQAPDWAEGRAYAPNGYRLCKYVLGLPGDVVETDGTTWGVRTSGGSWLEIGQFAQVDSSGRPLPQDVLKPGPVPDGTAVLIGTHARNSLDSRYLGPVDISTLTHFLTPVATRD